MNNKSDNFFLEGNYAPWHKENNFENIVSIVGEIPKEFYAAMDPTLSFQMTVNIGSKVMA